MTLEALARLPVGTRVRLNLAPYVDQYEHGIVGSKQAGEVTIQWYEGPTSVINPNSDAWVKFVGDIEIVDEIKV